MGKPVSRDKNGIEALWVALGVIIVVLLVFLVITQIV